jgi:deoxyadenosine/deoxycytidine kinase
MPAPKAIFGVIPMSKHLVMVAGNIGAGKSSLTERLGARLGWRTAYESVSDNPYLPDFYADMRAWSFHLQVFFLGHRAQQYLDLIGLPQSAILDRSIYEDAHIFARALHHMGNLSERDYLAYRRVFDLIVSRLPVPDLLIYLRAPVQVLIDRIRSRGRAIEGGITPEYLTLLESFYDEWMQTFDICPVLTIRTDEAARDQPGEKGRLLDFVHNPAHLDLILERVQDRLSGREDLILSNG